METTPAKVTRTRIAALDPAAPVAVADGPAFALIREARTVPMTTDINGGGACDEVE
jgi:hypothetical protein